ALRLFGLTRVRRAGFPPILWTISRPWSVLHPEWLRDPEALRTIARLGVDYYRRLDAFVAKLDPERRVEILYDDLVRDPETAVQGIYHHLGLPLGDAYRATLHEMSEHARGYRSSHRYDLERLGLSREWIYQALPDVFERRGFDPGLA
ncbi:MAG: sulfotransferase, partial [Myxococcota bacterium]